MPDDEEPPCKGDAGVHTLFNLPRPSDLVSLEILFGHVLFLRGTDPRAFVGATEWMPAGGFHIEPGTPQYEMLDDHGKTLARLQLSLSMELVEKARSAVWALKDGIIYAALSQAQRDALEATLYVIGRPSLPLRKGRPACAAPPVWSMIDMLHDHVARLSAMVGRIDVDGHQHAYAGTGFVIGERLIVTNRHVAAQFCEGEADETRLKSEAKPRIAFGYEDCPDPGMTVPIKRIAYISTVRNLDFAILETDDTLPPALPLNRNAKSSPGTAVCAIGYPDKDQRIDPDIGRSLFGDVYGIKRLSPGYIRDHSEFPRYNWAATDILHDCTTLGNSSGSCIVDLETCSIVGLHAAGAGYQVNKSIASSLIYEIIEAL